MYTTVVGKTFLKEYNRRNKKDYAAKDFFDEVLFKLFFDDKKYMMWAQNSPFVQGISKKKPYFEPHERVEKLAILHEKISNGERDASIAIAYPASENKKFATTSGAVTDLEIVVEDEDVYYSWIGGMLSLGIAGGYALLFNNPEITYATFEGWQVYRNFLNDPVLDKLPGNKILTWNGQWLTHRLGKRYSKDYDFNTFLNIKAIERNDEKHTIEISTVEWSKLFFSLSNQYPDTAHTAYVFALGQTNKTIGFIPFQFQQGRRLHQIYQKLFGEENYKTNATDFEALFGKHIKRACELGNVGLQALEPKNLSKYFKDGKNLNLGKPNIKKKTKENEEDFDQRKQKAFAKDRDNIITFRTYKTWLIAMLTKNKQELLDYTKEIAKALVKYREGAKKRDRASLLEQKLFGNKSKSAFLENLTAIVMDDSVEIEIIQTINELRNRAFLMSKEDFGYLWLLLKFDYAYEERILQNTKN